MDEIIFAFQNIWHFISYVLKAIVYCISNRIKNFFFFLHKSGYLFQYSKANFSLYRIICIDLWYHWHCIPDNIIHLLIVYNTIEFNLRIAFSNFITQDKRTSEHNFVGEITHRRYLLNAEKKIKRWNLQNNV